MLGEKMMRSLGRSVGRKGRALMSSNTNRFIVSNTDTYNRTAPFLHFSRCTHSIAENAENMCHKMEDEANRGSGYNLTTVLRKGKELLWGQRGLKEGDNVDLSDLLFTEDRDYLIKCNGGQQVKAEQLGGKVVVLYFDSLLHIDDLSLDPLKLVYNDLQPKNHFEVVFVDTNDFDASARLAIPHETHAGEPFINLFPTMPWTAIPLSDVTSRKHLKQIFGLLEEVYYGNIFIIDPRGTIVQWSPDNIFSRYGAAGYPFDKATIDFLDSEDEKTIKNPTLKALLANHERDYLISNKGDKVPIDTLEDKVVALFFYTECKLHQEFTAKLKVAYKELLQKDKKFEVVLIYLYDKQPSGYITSEEMFSDTFKTMPWLALPFKDSNYKKLERLFFLAWDLESLDHALVIIGPHMKFIEPFGLDILWLFNSPAYPFTCERVAELVAEEAKKLKLAMLWETNSVFNGHYGSKVELSDFAGKRVIVLYDWYPLRVENAVKFIETLKEKYDRFRSTDKEFEVIHITRESYSNEHVKNLNLPWVVEPVRDYRDEPKIFGIRGQYHKGPSLLAFNEDGDIVRKTIYPTLEEKYFPFYSGGLEKEALSQLVEVFEWDWLPESYPETIYAYKKNRAVVCTPGF